MSTEATMDMEYAHDSPVNWTIQALSVAVVVFSVGTENMYDHESLPAMSLLWHS